MAARIYLVDNNMYSRAILRDILVSHGYYVCGEASSGDQALESYERVRANVYIVAAAMPDLDGVATIKALKRKNSDLQIVLSASSGQRSLAMEAIRAGAVDFIAKPYNARRVIATLKKNYI